MSEQNDPGDECDGLPERFWDEMSEAARKMVLWHFAPKGRMPHHPQEPAHD